MPYRSTATLAAIAALALASPAAVAATPAGPSAPCFSAAEWQNWSSPSPNVIYLRLDTHAVYRLDLSAGSDALQWAGTHLVNRMHGSEYVCSPVDLDLEVTDDQGALREPLIVKSFTKLTPDEVQAIPAKYRP